MLLMKIVGPLEAEQEKQLNIVQDSAHHLLALINDVLDISKIEAGQFEISSEEFNLRDSITSCVTRISPLAEKKHIQLSSFISPEVDTVISDKRRVEQVILNLLSNAVKFTEKGKVTIESHVKKDMLIISVQDTGIGMKPEQLGLIFQPFRQLDSGITRQHEGTGLGLSICKRMIEIMGGKIWVTSEWGKGSTFTFSLPSRKE